MNWVKNILFVSYLKNKGIRRICFILGCVLVVVMIVTTPKFYDNNRIDKEYLNINDIKRWADVYRDVNIMKHLALVDCTSQYFEILGIKDVRYSLYLDNSISGYCSLSDKPSCDKFKLFADEKIKLNCGLRKIFVYRPLITILFFYLPFVFAVLFKFLWLVLLWIGRGFKESKK